MRGRKFVVENHRVNVVRLAEFSKFLRFALADERGGVQRFHFLDSVAGDFRAGGLREFGQLVERFAEFRAVARLKFDADEKNAFGAFASEIDECFQFFASGRIA